MAKKALGSDLGRGVLRPSRSFFVSSLVLLVVYFCLLPVDTLPDDQLFLLPVILTLVTAPIWSGSWSQYRFSRIGLVASASLIFLSVHWFGSDWPWMSIWLGACLALLPAGVLVTCNLEAKKHIERALPFILVAIGVANALFILYQGWFVDRRPGGFLDDPNLGANIIAIAVLCSAYLYLSKKVSHLMLVLAALMSAALFFAQSRGAWVALLFSAVVLFLVFLISSQNDRQRPVFFVLALLTGLAVPFLLTETGLAESVGVGVRSGSLGYRFDIWASSWELITQRPLLGSGIGTFPLRYPSVRSPLETSTTGHFAHSDIIQLFVELGFSGALLFLLVPFSFMAGFVLHVKKHGAAFGLPLLAFCVVALVGLHGLVNFVIYQPLVALTVGLLIGIATQKGSTGEKLTFNAPFRRVLGIACVSIFALVFATSTADLMASRKIAEISKSDDSYDLQSNIYYDLLFLEMLSPLNINIKNHIIEAEVASAMGLVGTDMGFHFRQQVIERIESNRRYYEPNCFQLSERGRMLWFDDQEQAVLALESLIEAAPDCYRGYLHLSEAYVDQKRFSDAEQLLEKAFQRFKFGVVNAEQAAALLDALAEVIRRQGRESEARSIEAFSRSN